MMNHFKKLISGLFLLLLFSSSIVSAQELEKKGYFGIGAEGGVQLTNISGFGGIYGPVSGVGYTAGVFGEYYISNDFRLRLGAFYDNRKFGLEGGQPYLVNQIDDSLYVSYQSYYFYQVDYSLNYVTLPFGINYAKGNEHFKISLQLNFYYSFLVGATRKGSDDIYIYPDHAQYFIDVGDYENSNLQAGHNITEYSGSTDGVSIDQDTQSFLFNPNDFGMNFLIGGVYNVTPKIGIGASIGFTLAFAQLFEDAGPSSKWSQATKFNLGVTYLLEKKNKQFGK